MTIALHYTRPVKGFYDSLLGVVLSEPDWLGLDHRFHEAYGSTIGDAGLADGALAALDLVSDLEMSQSLLSMYPHAALVPLVEQIGIAGRFVSIEGLRGTPGDTKARYLANHLSLLDVAGNEALVMGDTPDDAYAADILGAACILIDNGSHHREALVTTGARVIDHLAELVDLL